MKKILIITFLFTFTLINAQERFNGKVIEQSFIRLTYNSPVKSLEKLKINIKRLEIDKQIARFSTFGLEQDISFASTIGNLNWAGTDSVQYDDRNVKPGNGYVYWLQTPEGIILVGPLYFKVWDPELWYSQAKIEGTIDGLEKAYPGLVKKIKFGETVQKNPIYGIVCGNPDNAILLIGYTHPGESGAELILYTVEQALLLNKDLLKTTGIVAIPVLNIDARNLLTEGFPQYKRHNINGVDLNRNYPAEWEKNPTNLRPFSGNYPGPSGASEPETQSVIKAIDMYNPKMVLDYHWMGTLTGCDFLSVNTTDALKTKIDQMAKKYAEGYNFDVKDPLPGKVSISRNPATTTRYCVTVRNIPAVTLEGWSRSREFPGLLRAEYGLATKEDLNLYQKKHYLGVLEILKYLSRSN